VRTRLARSTGTDKHYKLGAVRALPTKKKDTVVLQATDGRQAVCLIAPGRMRSPRLVPPVVLPKRKDVKGVVIDLADERWRSSEGRSTPDEYAGESCYPSIAEVLPKLGTRAQTRRVQLGIDVALLSKVADSLGTSKLTLFIPIPDKTREPGTDDGGHVKKPIAICPATDDGGVRGIGVVMPLQPVNGVRFYAKVRQLVVDAEARCKTRPANRPAPV